jgi:hypothetical protein
VSETAYESDWNAASPGYASDRAHHAHHARSSESGAAEEGGGRPDAEGSASANGTAGTSSIPQVRAAAVGPSRPVPGTGCGRARPEEEGRR